MSQNSDEPLMRAHTNTHTSLSSEVLTADLLGTSSLYQTVSRERGLAPEMPPLSAHSLSFADYTSASHTTNIRPHENHTNTTLVLSRGSTPQVRGSSDNSDEQVLERLAVESDSSRSVEVSVPYHEYDLSNYSRSLNTLNLLQSGESTPLVVENSQLRDRLAREASQKFNQVPQRFSQFILDQNNVLAVSGATSSHSSGPISRQISLSMGSQATIFSTRSDTRLQDGLRRRQKRSIKSSRAGVDSEIDPSPLSLERRKAIRSKEGSKMYRIRLFLRKFAARLRRKIGALSRFVTGSKKATSKAQPASHRPFLGRQGSKKSRKTASRAIPQISAPLANPDLEAARGASRVEGLSDELKARAGLGGVPGENSKNQETQNDGKTSHLSKYLSDQKNISLQRLAPETVASMVSSVAPPPPPHKNGSFKRKISESPEKERIRIAWNRYLSNVLASRIRLRQEVQLFQLLLANQPIPSVFNKTPNYIEGKYLAPVSENGQNQAKSSRRWSESVGEIKSHRASLVPGKYSSAGSEAESFLLNAASSLAPTAPSESPSHFTHSGFSKGPELSIEESSDFSDHSALSTEHEDESSDEKIEQIQQVLNRRSMLGEMLDYDSDELASEASSTYSKDSLGVSVQNTRRSDSVKITDTIDTQLVKRYGTVRRRHTDKSSYYGGSNGSSEYPDSSSVDTKSMSRSPGFSNLQVV